MSNSTLVTQVGGSHYKDLPIQPVEFIARNGLSFIEGSIVKYVTRYKNKNGIEDLRKVAHFIELHYELLEKEPELFGCVRVALSRLIQRLAAATTACVQDHVIDPEYYLAKNEITNPDAQHLIIGVCIWRDRARMGDHNKQTMLKAVRNLIADEMLGVDQQEDEA